MGNRFRRAALIFNPAAGKKAAASRIEQIRSILQRSVRDVRLTPTEAPGHAELLAHEAQAAGCDLVAVLGGDGTVNEALQGLVPGCSPDLLVLPGGTANVLAKEVGLPREPRAAAARLPELVPRMVTLGCVDFSAGGRRYFLLMCGAGLDAAIASRTPPALKNRLGLSAFWLRGAEQVLRRFPRLRVSAGPNAARNGHSSLVVISKSRRYGGGLVFTPTANLLSSDFEVAQFAGTNPFRYCGYLLAGVGAMVEWWPGIHLSNARWVSLEPLGPTPVPVQVDGEAAGILPARVCVSNISIRLLLPKTYATPRRPETALPCSTSIEWNGNSTLGVAAEKRPGV